MSIVIRLFCLVETQHIGSEGLDASGNKETRKSKPFCGQTMGVRDRSARFRKNGLIGLGLG